VFLLQVIKSNRVIGAAATVLWDIAFADSRHCVQLVGVALIAAASLLPHTTPMPPPYLFCCQCNASAAAVTYQANSHLTTPLSPFGLSDRYTGALADERMHGYIGGK